MNICPRCHARQERPDAQYCTECGCTLNQGETVTNTAPDNTADTDPDFVVSEAHHEINSLVGDEKPKPMKQDDLGVETNANLVENSDAADQVPPVSDVEEESSLIGDTSAQIPLPAYEEEPPAVEETDFRPLGNSEPVPEEDPSALPKLSSEELSRIEQQMATPKEFLSEEEKRNLIQKMDDIDEPFGNAPIIPPKRRESKEAEPSTPAPIPDNLPPRPEMAGRSRGVAYFYKNYVQFAGESHLHEYDEVSIGDRSFVLRKKTFSTKMIAAVGAPIFGLILLIIALQFISGGGSGNGKIAGVVVDEYSQPFLQGAFIKFPDLGKTYKSNPQGLFVTDPLPAGTHRIEWVLDGEIVGADYTTVVEGEVSTVTIRPSEEVIDDLADEGAGTESVEIASVTSPSPETAKKTSSPAKSSKSRPAKKKSSSKSSKSSPAKLKLAANVEGAKLTLDGKVLGAGNLTYSKLKTGKRSYSVSADGYETVSGRVTLSSGKTKTLKVTLAPLTQAAKEESYSADDFYYSGVTAYRDSDPDAALADLTEAIRINPGYAEAYTARGDVYASLRNHSKAHDDYLQSAEIFRMRKKFSLAISEYNKALKADEKSIPAHMGRASLFMAKKEELAAIADYESVTMIDRRNFDAYYGLGEARYKRGNYKKAIKHFKDARSISPESPKVYQYLMLSYLAANDIKNVKKSYEKFTEVAPSSKVDEMQSDRTYTAVMRVVNTQ